jgi:hypothetical protein
VLHCTICAKVWHVVTATGNRAMAVVVDSSSNRDPITSSCSTGRRRSAQFRSRSSESRSTGFRSRREKLASDGQPDSSTRSGIRAAPRPSPLFPLRPAAHLAISVSFPDSELLLWRLSPRAPQLFTVSTRLVIAQEIPDGAVSTICGCRHSAKARARRTWISVVSFGQPQTAVS